jgi:hypothetical protein
MQVANWKYQIRNFLSARLKNSWDNIPIHYNNLFSNMGIICHKANIEVCAVGWETDLTRECHPHFIPCISTNGNNQEKGKKENLEYPKRLAVLDLQNRDTLYLLLKL